MPKAFFGSEERILIRKKTWKIDFSFYLRAHANLAEASVETNIESMKVILKRYPTPTIESVYLVKDVMLQNGLSNTYVNKVLTAATHFFRWQGYDISFKRMTEPEGVIEYLEKAQIRLLFEAIDSQIDEHIVYRDAALTAAILYSGLRPSEVRRLKVSDVDIDKREIKVRKPKNRHPDITIIPLAAIDYWKDWLSYRSKDKRYDRIDWMFITEEGKSMKYAAIRKRFRTYSDITGFRITATILRHSLGTLMKKAGADILDIKAQMRHRNIKSTLKYVNFDKEDLKKKVDQFLPGF